ncbi:NUDIX domain-containing protein [Adhaeribacter rhizoryzae]|uniref:ADP-ribose pyrophosphatase n=1 Tax=Adhaeribacter rhizoryzae TaxID=2607907 RepID=A0A5M6DM45_9BACT|nr:NUDIX hydrolase [Adhaeribacter rhizoryzae]KAA5546445.1 NUDIX hydrolase [Adhaeribacter rhizoryzae]
MKEINRKTVYDGFFKLYKITYEDDGKTFDREVFVTGNAVAALLYDTQKDKFIFVKQFRPAVNQDMLELVAGLLDKEGESPEEAMIREIEEESGYAVDKLEPVINFYPSPGAFAEKLHVYYAEVSRKVGEGGGADGENEKIKLIELTKAELKDKIFNDAKTLIAVQWAKLKGII